MYTNENVRIRGLATRLAAMLHPAYRSLMDALAIFAVVSLTACTTTNFAGMDSSPAPDTGVRPGGETPAIGQPVAEDEGYQIGPEDVLFISVWNEPDLQREVTVRPDGGISFPLAGNLNVAGKSTTEVTEMITQRVQKYIPGAVVTVSVEKVSGYNVFVIGQVNEPGQFTLGRYVDVIQALTLAGGVTPFADIDEITIRRRENGREVVLPFDYSEVRAGNNMGQNVVLESGDVVVVP